METMVQLQGIVQEDFKEILLWCVEAFDKRVLPDRVLYRTLAILCRTFHETWFGERRMMASVILAVKLTVKGSLPDLPFVVRYLSNGRVPFGDVAPLEAIIVNTLDGDVDVPTAIDFLDLLGHGLPTWGGSVACRRIAEIVLQLSLVDLSLHVDHPGVVLAASAWATAFCAAEAPTEAWSVLVGALNTCSLDAWSPLAGMLQCARGILKLWKLRGQCSQVDQYLVVVLRKFRGLDACRVLDVMQLGWPWLRSRIAQGVTSERKR